MKLDFTQNTKKNIIASTLSKGLALLLPFLNRTLFLWLLGPKYLGLNGLFSSILGVLMLAELGFGTAIVCSMYKPIADDDHELICAYLNFYRIVYRWVGTAIFIGGLCLLPFLRKLIHSGTPPGVDLHILFLMFLTNTAVSYFLFAYRGALIAAYQRNYVLTNLQSVLQLLQYLSVFAVLVVTHRYGCPRPVSYYLYVIVTILFTVIRNLLVMRESKRLFPNIIPQGKLPEEKRKRVIADVRAIFLHKIGGVISYTIDNVVLSAFQGLVSVAAYGNYYYVYNNVKGLPAIVYSTMDGGFGNRIHTASREENFKLLMRVHRMVSIVIIWCSALMLALYQPFIEEWCRGKNRGLVQHFLTAVLLVIYFFINQSRQVLLTYKSAAALWREDQWKPVAGSVVKLGLSILFVLYLPKQYKLDGVILSSIIGYVAIQIPWESHVMFTAYFDRQQAKRYWLAQLRCALLTAAVAAAVWAATTYLVPLHGVRGLLCKAALAGTLTTGLVFALFPRDLMEMLQKMLARRK